MTSVVEQAFDALQSAAHGRVERSASLAGMTSYRLGGSAAIFLEAESEADLQALARVVGRTGLDLLILGRGSNLLVSDLGFDGIAVRLGSGFRWSRIEGTHLRAGAAVPLPSLAVLAAERGLAGFEFAVAIPASLGGAVRMNAGAHGRETGEVLEEVGGIVIPSGEAVSIRRPTHTYRATDLPQGLVVTRASLALTPGDTDAISARLREAREWRRAHQPLNLPNAGSVFKNPAGESAGRLIERICGPMVVGRARISEVHANFIVAERGARADEVYTLIRRIQRSVAESAGIALEPEVRLVGAFEEVSDDSAVR